LKTLRAVSSKFHARFNAKGKVYRYHVHLGAADPFEVNYCWSLNRELDWPAVQAAAKVLRGKHDFWAFSGENDRTYETTVRNLRRLDVSKKGQRVTGALVNVGLGKLTPANLAELIKSRRRIPMVVTAPPQGLFLVKVLY
jgi:tRNA pseudouridine38-40 synthase